MTAGIDSVGRKQKPVSLPSTPFGVFLLEQATPAILMVHITNSDKLKFSFIFRIPVLLPLLHCLFLLICLMAYHSM